MADATARVSWRSVVIVFVVGVVVWIALLIVTVFLVKAASGWYPATIPSHGGELQSWLGPGWWVEQTFCFGTNEMCANYDSSPTFYFSPIGTVATLLVWAAISTMTGWVAARRHNGISCSSRLLCTGS